MQSVIKNRCSCFVDSVGVFQRYSACRSLHDQRSRCLCQTQSSAALHSHRCHLLEISEKYKNPPMHQNTVLVIFNRHQKNVLTNQVSSITTDFSYWALNITREQQTCKPVMHIMQLNMTEETLSSQWMLYLYTTRSTMLSLSKYKDNNYTFWGFYHPFKTYNFQNELSFALGKVTFQLAISVSF